MTREEIMAMEAGPELDALVAELVLGETLDWEHSWAHRAKGERISEWHCTACGQRWGWRAKTPRCTNPLGGRHLSKDIGQAWKVVEKLRPEHAHVLMNTARSDEHLPERMATRLQVEIQSHVDDLLDQSGRTWYVAFYRMAGGIVSRNDGHGWAKSLPLAICRAALQTVVEAA